MTDTLFKEVRSSFGGLINDLGIDLIGLPDIQLPFVWAIASVMRQGHRNLVAAVA